ncbi:MAG: sulfatase-like hydrolase/transferase, partial [Egibacteraceae bacterium]
LKTGHSLASTLNLRYLTDLTETYGPDNPSFLPVYDLLQRHQVGRLLKDRGYTYVHIGAWWDPTQTNHQADVNLGYERRSDFELAFWHTTMLSEATADRREKSADQRRRVTYRGAKAQFRQVRSAVDRPGPTFTFAHILLPHQPFVFDRRGRYVSLKRDGRRGHERGYIEQLEYTNDQIRLLLDDLLDVPADQQPIVVLQADEGPHPLSFLQFTRQAPEDRYRWDRITTAELREKFRILSAYYLPGTGDPGPYPSISPVNTWRLIFDRYFGADLPLLEDRSWIHRTHDHPYDFSDVTDRVRVP